MGVSATGQGMHMSAVRNGIATALVVLALFFYLYGPPLTDKMRRGRQRRVQRADRQHLPQLPPGLEDHHVLRRRRPHWQCYPVGKPASKSVDLGWWVGL